MKPNQRVTFRGRIYYITEIKEEYIYLKHWKTSIAAVAHVSLVEPCRVYFKTPSKRRSVGDIVFYGGKKHTVKEVLKNDVIVLDSNIKVHLYLARDYHAISNRKNDRFKKSPGRNGNRTNTTTN